MMQKIFHIDLNFMMLRKELFRPLLKRAADFGYNAILWEVEDKIQWETCPECVRPDAFSKQEFSELLAYSRSLGLEPIPLLQTLGHAEYVLNNEEYASIREGGQSRCCYCISRPAVLNLLQNWIQEYLDLFGDIHDFHFGGDEAWQFGQCPECAGKIEEMGKLGFAMTHYAALSDRLIRAGIRPNMWGDLMLQHPDELPKHLPLLKHFRIWDWQYTTNWDSPFDTTEKLSSAGLDVVLCSSIRCWDDKIWIPGAFHLDNTAATAAQAVRRGLSGYCVTSWMIRLISFDLQWFLMAAAPLSEHASDAEKRLAAYRTAAGFDSTEDADAFLKAVKLAAADFPLSTVHELGVGVINGKDHTVPPHGWFANRIIKRHYDGAIPVTKFAEAEQKLNEAQSLFERLAEKYPERIRPWLESLALEKDQLTLTKMIAARDPRGGAFLRELREKARKRFRTYFTETSADDAVRLLYTAVEDFFADL